MESDEENESNTEKSLDWSELIFIPFHPVFQLMVLYSVILKCVLGPIQAVYPIVYCHDEMDLNVYLSFIKYCYLYFADLIYGADTFLHIIHRQITDKAYQREYLPKPVFLLLLDIVSMIPFYRLSSDLLCPPPAFWPNVMSFTEFLCIYKVFQYFSLLRTHSYMKMILGYFLLISLSYNCLTCFFILLPTYGVCSKCANGTYDWRNSLSEFGKPTLDDYNTYVHAFSFVYVYIERKMIEHTHPFTITEYFICSMLMIFGFGIETFIILPKIVMEYFSRNHRYMDFYTQVSRVINETKRRNPSPLVHLQVENFYYLMWEKRGGVINFPTSLVTQLPRYLRWDIKQELVWSVFYHSPTFRRTTTAFKRWLSEFIHLEYKLPGENFFSGPNSQTNLYYLNSGIVQLISTDDGLTPLLSVSSGTIFGDVAFFIPSLKRKEPTTCLTYCEVFYVSRSDLLKTLHKFPVDRQEIFMRVKSKIKHARTLNNCKQNVKGLDRTEDEGIAWIKRRWWEIADAFSYMKKITNKELESCELPAEEANYHCAKYIGQLVLCNDAQLRRKSLFANINFPWILLPDSAFLKIWGIIIYLTVLAVLILYPLYLMSSTVPGWFRYFQFVADVIYPLDLLVLAVTSFGKGEDAYVSSFSAVLFSRFKSFTFVLDVLATIWIEKFIIMINKPHLYYLCQFNRLIKIHILFSFDRLGFNFKTPAMLYHVSKLILTLFSFFHIAGSFSHILKTFIPGLTTTNYFTYNNGDDFYTSQNQSVFDVIISWTFLITYFYYPKKTFTDVHFAVFMSSTIFVISLLTNARLIGALYLKFRDISEYQFFVSKIKRFYIHYRIHPDLLVRLDRYLTCHWKYDKGMDAMHPNIIKNEPFDIYWKSHGEIAVKIIGNSRAFLGAKRSLIKELASESKFLVLPKHAVVLLLGMKSDNITWLVKGLAYCEYYNEIGEIENTIIDPGEVLSISSTLFDKTAIRTYKCYTDCEILNINKNDFQNILNRYSEEMSFIQKCVVEVNPMFDKIYSTYIRKHLAYNQKQHDSVFQPSNRNLQMLLHATQKYIRMYEIYWSDPESRFTQYWLYLRAFVVIVSIMNSCLQCGSGALYRKQLRSVSGICDAIAIVDVLFKLFLGYYNDNGILVMNKWKCAVHYLTRGFLFDIIGIFPWYHIVKNIPAKPLQEEDALLINIVCKFAHIYLLHGFFNYIVDKPTINMGLIMVMKWQVTMFLIMLGSAQFFLSNCLHMEWDNSYNLVAVQIRNNCWLPLYMPIDNMSQENQIHLVFAQSLSFAQSGILKVNLGKFLLDYHNRSTIYIIFILEIGFWFVLCYSIAMLTLRWRGHRLFKYNVTKLIKFLKSERVEEKLIYRSIAHFRFWWQRTNGVNIRNLMGDRVGIAFKQDLIYFFLKITLNGLDTLLQGGENIMRQLASASKVCYFISKETVVREMDLNPHVYIVHRGKVAVKKNNEVLGILTKGCIFGQLSGREARPLQISAETEEDSDVIEISSKEFQQIINNNIRRKIKANPQSKYDYMTLKEPLTENPYNTLEYILKGRKFIKLPWMLNSMIASDGNFYTKYLFFAWVLGPVISSIIVMVLNTLNITFLYKIYWLLIILDLFHLMHFVTEFYTLDLIVQNEKCVYQPFLWRKFKHWGCYADIASLLIPYLSFVTGKTMYQLARLIRLRYLFNFHYYFCRSFKALIMPLVFNFLIIILLLHAFTCGWMAIACKEWNGNFPVPVSDIEVVKNNNRSQVLSDEWVTPAERKSGCAIYLFHKNNEGGYMGLFLVPKKWLSDYVIAMTYIIATQTSTNLNTIVPLTIGQVYYKIFTTFCVYLITIWLGSLAVSNIFLRLRDLYQYDNYVHRLIKYLSSTGLSPTLLNTVSQYTNLLWERQKGNWIPELVLTSPICLRVDLLSAIYLHHLENQPLYRDLPHYFKRQLVARVQRVMIFPGKYILQEGEIYPCTFFIHQGNVEKWQTDSRGEKKFIGMLTSNGVFGEIPGLFPDIPHRHSYYTRTVVDIVYLRHQDWQDLLDGYPGIKTKIYTEAKLLLKKDN